MKCCIIIGSLPASYTILNHRLRSTVVRVTSHFNRVTQNLTPPIYPKPLHFSEPKFEQMITSGISPDMQNLVKIRLGGASHE